MSLLFPRLPRPVAVALSSHFDSLSPADSHHSQVYAPVGGRRATAAEVAAIREQLTKLASEHGFPNALPAGKRLEFDRETALLLIEIMDLSWSEAAAHDMWSFLAVVALPDLTRWRFGTSNVERWIATDLTRHTWARAWWRGTVFRERPDLLNQLTESDLNQMLERRVIGGDPRLVIGLSQALLKADATVPGHRRALIRESAARLRRRLAFVDARALDDETIAALCDELLAEAAENAAVDPDIDTAEDAIDE